MTSSNPLHDLPAEDRPPTRSRRRPAGLLWALALGTLVLAIAIAVALRTDGGSSSAGASSSTTSPGGGPDLVGERLPTTPIETFDGRPVVLTDLVPEGKPAVVNFFASWCVPCVTEMPDLEQAHQAHGGQVTFVGVNVNDSVDNGRSTVTRTGVTYEVARDPLGDLLTAVGGVNMPTTVFVKADGTVAEVHTGQVTREEIDATLRNLGA